MPGLIAHALLLRKWLLTLLTGFGEVCTFVHSSGSLKCQTIALVYFYFMFKSESFIIDVVAAIDKG